MLVITTPWIGRFKEMRPDTHEIGGVVHVKNGEISRLEMVKGSACRDPNGVLIDGKVCSLLHPTGDFVLHTHPIANRPSSTDLKIAIESEHQCNIVVCPLGIYAYAPTAELRKKYLAMSDWERKTFILELRFIGHMEQAKTQVGDCEDYLNMLRKCGFNVTYESYSSGRELRF